MLEGREDENITGIYGVEKGVCGLVIVAESIVDEKDKGKVLSEENSEDLFLMLGDERRDKDSALAGGGYATIHVLAEGLRVAGFGFVNEDMADVDLHKTGSHQKFGIPYSAVDTTGKVDVRLDTEEAGLEALGSEALGVHLYVAHHGIELTVAREGAHKRHLMEERIEGLPDRIRRNRQTRSNGEVGIGKALNRGRVLAAELFGGLPERAEDGHDALFHLAAYTNDEMEMIRHHTEPHDHYLWVTLIEMEEASNELFSEGSFFHISLGWVLFGDDELTEERFAAGHGEGHMVDADALPCRTTLLPMPLILRHSSKFGAKVQKNMDIRKYKSEKTQNKATGGEMPDRIRRKKRAGTRGGKSGRCNRPIMNKRSERRARDIPDTIRRNRQTR